MACEPNIASMQWLWVGKGCKQGKRHKKLHSKFVIERGEVMVSSNQHLMVNRVLRGLKGGPRVATIGHAMAQGRGSKGVCVCVLYVEKMTTIARA